MSLYSRREKFNDISVKIGLFFSRFRLSPNSWTLLSLIPAFLAFFFILYLQFTVAAMLFILAGFCDIADGSVAKVSGQKTKLGAYLDTIVDRYVEFLMIFGLLFITLPKIIVPSYVWIFLYMFGGTMTTYAKSSAKEKELTRTEIRGGILERAERLLILFFGLLLAQINLLYLVYVIIVLAILANISALQRIYIAIRSNTLFKGKLADSRKGRN